jgi:hypothetical protein
VRVLLFFVHSGCKMDINMKRASGATSGKPVTQELTGEVNVFQNCDRHLS